MEKEHSSFESGLVIYLQNDEKSRPKGSFLVITHLVPFRLLFPNTQKSIMGPQKLVMPDN
jgi:hypothetical protein